MRSAVVGDSRAAQSAGFHRADASRTASGEGIGLGLAIVESFAVTHGGELRLAPRSGGGLVATLSVPVPASRDEP